MIEILIVTRKGPHLNRCLESLFTHTPVPFNLHLMEEGESFPEAVNIGLSRLTAGHDLVLLDDDALVCPGWLADLDNYLEQADLIGARFFFEEDPQIIQEAGIEFTTSEAGEIALRFAEEGWVYGQGPPAQPRNFPALNTVALYIKHQVIQKLGVFNEQDYRWGSYFEDWDYVLQATQKGFRAVTADWPVIHLGAATKRHLPDWVYHRRLNEFVFNKKWLRNDAFLTEMGARFPLCETHYCVEEQLLERLSGRRLAVYGAGTLARALYPSIASSLAIVVDRNPSLWEQSFGKLSILPPPCLLEERFDCLLITPIGNSTSILSEISEFVTAEQEVLFLAYCFDRMDKGPGSTPFLDRLRYHLKIISYRSQHNPQMQ